MRTEIISARRNSTGRIARNDHARLDVFGYDRASASDGSSADYHARANKCVRAYPCFIANANFSNNERKVRFSKIMSCCAQMGSLAHDGALA
jgi:hypothetical protein